MLHRVCDTSTHLSMPIPDVGFLSFVQVTKERVRVGEFMKDFDKLKSGRVSCINFARALDLCGFELAPDEVMVLENRCVCGDGCNSLHLV